MSFQAKVVEDWKLALKNKDSRKDALSMIITELKNRAIKENISGGDGRVVNDAQAIEVLQKMAKQRKESIEAYMAANRPELAEKEKLELSVVESYLPKALTDEELKKIVQKVIEEEKVTSIKEMGKVMKGVIRASEGRADGKRIQAIVESLLK
jgi:uncharacterized protein YqeY